MSDESGRFLSSGRFLIIISGWLRKDVLTLRLIGEVLFHPSKGRTSPSSWRKTSRCWQHLACPQRGRAVVGEQNIYFFGTTLLDSLSMTPSLGFSLSSLSQLVVKESLLESNSCDVRRWNLAHSPRKTRWSSPRLLNRVFRYFVRTSVDAVHVRVFSNFVHIAALLAAFLNEWMNEWSKA